VNCVAPHHCSFPSLVANAFSYVQTFSSSPYSETPWIYISTSVWQMKYWWESQKERDH
jgi:hypothetical protein